VAAANYTQADLPALVACLKAAPAARLVTSYFAVRYVVVDGVIITAPRLNVRALGNSAHVPVLIGTMADDGAAFVAFPPDGTNRSAALVAVFPADTALAARVDMSPLFLTPGPSANATRGAFDLVARAASESEFQCLDQALAHTAVRSGV
jgi:hypothetical protein